MDKRFDIYYQHWTEGQKCHEWSTLPSSTSFASHGNGFVRSNVT